MINKILYALLLTVSIPALGYLTSTWILADMSEESLFPTLFQLSKVEELCRWAKLTNEMELIKTCTDASIYNVLLLKAASFWSGVAAVGLMVVYILLSLLLGKNRGAIAFIFPKLIPLSSLIIAILVLVEGAILTYSAYVGESYAIGRVHFILIGAVGLGSVIGAFGLIGATFSLNKDLIQNEIAKNISKSDSPKLWKFVEDIASKVGAKVPDNIIVGLEPNFYVTAAKVNLLSEDEMLTGETLYLSTSLMRIFDKEELSSVIGHELGHFRGKDTAYSLKFAPVYVGLGRSIAALSSEEGGGASSLAKLPAIAMLSLMYEMFSINERRISREREFEADKVGASVSSTESLATGLGKVAIYASLWNPLREGNIERLKQRKVTKNLSRTFEDSSRYDVEHRVLEDVMGEILQTRISHPTDTHPTISERYQNIGYAPESLTVDDLIKVGASINDVIDDPDSVEEELTIFEHQLMVGLGLVSPPEDDEEDQTNSLLNAIYFLAAAMVGADGKIEQSEVATAEGIGSGMFPDFDKVEFRECCNNLGDIPKFTDVVSVLGSTLKTEHRTAIYDYLKQIAMADEELAEKEKELLVHLRKEWELEDS